MSGFDAFFYEIASPAQGGAGGMIAHAEGLQIKADKEHFACEAEEKIVEEGLVRTFLMDGVCPCVEQSPVSEHNLFLGVLQEIFVDGGNLVGMPDVILVSKEYQISFAQGDGFLEILEVTQAVVVAVDMHCSWM